MAVEGTHVGCYRARKAISVGAIGLAVAPRGSICARRRSVLRRAVCRRPTSLVFLLAVLKPHVAGAVIVLVLGSARALPIFGVGCTSVHRSAGIVGSGRRASTLVRTTGEVGNFGVLRRYGCSRGELVGAKRWWGLCCRYWCWKKAGIGGYGWVGGGEWGGSTWVGIGLQDGNLRGVGRVVSDGAPYR
jgi:hypothetical protein